MDESTPPQHNPYWEQLLPRNSNDPSPGNLQSQWDPFSPTYNGASASYSTNRPSTSFSPDVLNSYSSNHARTTQHPRQNPPSPPIFPAINTPSTNLPGGAYQHFNPPQFAELQYPQPDHSQQLPAINTLTQSFAPADFPPSDLPWGSFGDDSLFDGEFWPDPQQNSFDININNNHNRNTHNDYYVDLTADASSPPNMPPVTRKRRTSATDAPLPQSTSSRNSKRPRFSGADVKREDGNVEHLDLVDVDDDGGLSKVLAQQQEAAIKEQQGPPVDVGTALSNIQCIICMEPMTDMSVTHCGKSFPRRCSVQAIRVNQPSGIRRSYLLPYMHHGSPHRRRESGGTRQGDVEMSGVPQESGPAEREGQRQA